MVKCAKRRSVHQPTLLVEKENIELNIDLERVGAFVGPVAVEVDIMTKI